jgi:hypothetical protein
MKANATYAFTVDKSNPATFGRNRFTIVIRQNPAKAYKLIDFTATKIPDAQKVQLVWQTANEQNYTNFTVERSTDTGKTFTVLGGLQGTGAGLYSLLDKAPVTGQNLYRLKQEDLNNTITYSKVISITYSLFDRDTVAKIAVYPNPTANVINLTINPNLKAAAFYIRIINSSGAVVKENVSQQNTWNANISNLKPGSYLVQVTNDNDKSIIGTASFVKN